MRVRVTASLGEAVPVRLTGDCDKALHWRLRAHAFVTMNVGLKKNTSENGTPTSVPTPRRTSRAIAIGGVAPDLPIIDGAGLLHDHEAFLRETHLVLARLHDYAWVAAHPFVAIAARVHPRRRSRHRQTGATEAVAPSVAVQALIDEIRGSIDAIEPRLSTPTDGAAPSRPSRITGSRAQSITRLKRRATLIRLRYLEAQSVETVQAHLQIKRSEYFRQHRSGIESVATYLRTRWAHLVQPSSEAPPVVSIGPMALPPTRFVGRTQEIAHLTQLIATNRFVTIVGPPGAGKTRLALEVARRTSISFVDGVVSIALAGLTDERLVGPSIGHAFGVYDVPAHALPESIAAHLRGKRHLLVLDNVEHVMGAAPMLARLVRAIPEMHVLATSRAPLNIVEEQRFLLNPLPVPPIGATDDDLAPIQTNDAVQLFVDRARAIDADFPSQFRDLEAAVSICRLLDGLPLALELAAARLATVNAPTIVRLLQEPGHLAALGTGPCDGPARHHSLQTAIAWSHSLLRADEASLFADLGIFVGGVSLDAIVAVVRPPSPASTDSDGHAEEILNRLTTLVTHSLVQRHDGPGGMTRFFLLETVRAYARALLTMSERFTIVGDRHAQYFLRVGTTASPLLRGSIAHDLLRQIDTDLPNIRAALDHFATSGHPLQAIALVVDLEGFWWLQGYRLEGYTRLQSLMDQAGDRLNGSSLARALAMAGHLCALNGEDSSARVHLTHALTQAQASTTQRAECDALHHLGVLARARGDDHEAETFWVTCVARADASGDPYRVGISMWHLGMLAIDRLDQATALQWLMNAARHFDRHAMPIGRALVAFSEGHALLISGDRTDARRLIDGAIQTLDAGGSKTGVMYAQTVRATLEYLEGNDTGAADATNASIALMQSLGQTRGIARNLITLGHIATAQGRRDRAQRLYIDALHRSLPADRLPIIAAAMIGLAGVAAHDAHPSVINPTEAPRLLRAGRAIGAAIGRPLWLVEQAYAQRFVGGLHDATRPCDLAEAMQVARAIAATIPPPLLRDHTQTSGIPARVGITPMTGDSRARSFVDAAD